MSRVSLIFPHQLFEKSPVLKEGQVVYLIEEYLFFQHFTFHKQKLAYHRASMKAYQVWLEEKGVQVHYIETHMQEADIRTWIDHLGKKKIKHLDCIDPTDDWLRQRVVKHARQAALEITWHESPMFLNETEGLNNFFSLGKRKYLQTEFYIEQRKTRNILVENGMPAGGKWTYDTENRKRYPTKKRAPGILFSCEHTFYREAVEYVSIHFPDAPGEWQPQQFYPYTFKDSREWLQEFLQNRFHNFGEYEDAIVAEESILHHSVLTPMLNVGLLTPGEIVEAVLKYSAKHAIPINSLEGFLRQLIGWREFIRGVYGAKGRFQRTKNYWNFHRAIPKSFYDGTTGIEPVDATIRKVLKTGYCHHIERLMVLGNFMFLCGFHPDAVYRWFMELFIDAYDWVMVPNIYGMSQFADGGLMATKPYISGSNYILKMSNYKKGDWCEIWDGLYWMFIYKHQKDLVRNPRMSMMVRQLQKMDPDRFATLKSKKEQFLAHLGI